MSFAAVLGIALVIGTTLILGVAIVSYVSSLAKNAYELKVEMRRDLDDGLKAMEAEVARALKWARGELAGEIEKSRALMAEDLERRQAEIEARLAAGIETREAAWAAEREGLRTEIALLEDRLARVEHRLVGRVRKVEAAAPDLPEPEPAPGAATPLALTNFEAAPTAAKARAR